ncbi:hypothetical protein Tco_1360287 [Tanacetum coccineum]
MTFQDSRLAMIKMLGYMNGTKTFHGWLICHGWITNIEWNLVTILDIFASHFASRMDMLNGPLAIGKKNCNGGELPEVIQIGDEIYFESYEWYKNLEDGELKDEALNSKAILEESINMEEESSDNSRTHCSPIGEWEDFERGNHIGSDVNSNYNPYLDVSRKFNYRVGTNNDYETQENEERFVEHELMGDDDDDIGDFEDYLIRKDPPYYVNEEEENSKERRCKLLGIPYVKPPTCKSKKFEVVKYSFEPAEEYVAIKEYEYDIWI